ncbi:hypothetical protein [Arthrobacter sp. zg-Y1171]|uniref:hypothetical protein n=1 Tax=Arthrobacter sp. zg-Y1171 TaxID=2964610 RepID=UPI00210489AA|nr:hypothetical protein [Arthrobacter sp. zg-Y1171]MCQ1994365.1 hypothetical protein [Arthrobacter sp. zg-Y1171]UWX81544.1 hypothetical protein N2L00_14285 [Arthrobacter sp. zg-Y1171]
MAVFVIAGLALSGCSASESNSNNEGRGDSEAADDSSEDTFTAKGVLRDRTLPGYRVGEVCDGPNVFNLQDGYEFKIQAEGKTVAMGTLPSGTFSKEEGNFCEFEFSVDDVPAGLGFYTIDLGERNGHKEFSEEEMRTGVVTKTEKFEGGI